jgi:hypothetical protein
MPKSNTLPHRDVVVTLRDLEQRGLLTNKKVIGSLLGAAKTVIPALVAKKPVAKDEKPE